MIKLTRISRQAYQSVISILDNRITPPPENQGPRYE
jgi:hypothetical protein